MHEHRIEEERKQMNAPEASKAGEASLIERLRKLREFLNEMGFFGKSIEGPGDPQVNTIDDAITALRSSSLMLEEEVMLAECHKQLTVIIDDGEPTDWKTWRADIEKTLTSLKGRNK